MKILIADKIATKAISNLKKLGAQVTFNPDLNADELSDAIDIRAGMAMGVGFIGIDGSSSGEPSDVGFAYDFLLGAGYNFNENWSLCFDYKYYLSAANDNYERVKAHMLLLSANFQL